MTRSMTGFGRAQKIIEGRDILVEIRSVNHRYYEFSSRLPRAYGYLDDKLKTLIQNKISRGKVEVSVVINNVEEKNTIVQLNSSMVKGYINALRQVDPQLGLRDDLTLNSIFRIPDAFNVQKTVEDEDEICNCVCEVANEAAQKFVLMRETEGERLKNDVLSRIKTIYNMVSAVEELSPLTVENYRNKLYQKLTEILESSQIDQQRILTEAAIFADKIAVDEETVRLRSHMSQLQTLLGTDEPIGRKLDFIVQEMNREVNTIGSKAQDIQITKLVVNMKSEIEKIREQIQNIE